MKTPRVELIKWRDSQMFLTQIENVPPWEVSEITSVGFVLDEDDDRIVLAGDMVGKDVRRVIVIPKENIIV